MTSNQLEVIERGNYISFATRKRSGDWVATPVWFAPDGESYYVFTASGAGKMKRLRNFSESRIATCTMSGALRGDWVDTQATIVETPEEIEIALAALRRKYGWQMHMTDLLSRITGKMGKRAYVRIDHGCGNGVD